MATVYSHLYALKTLGVRLDVCGETFGKVDQYKMIGVKVAVSAV